MDYGEWLKRNTNSIPDASEVVSPKKKDSEESKFRSNISIRRDFATLLVPYATTLMAVKKWMVAFCANITAFTSSGSYNQMEYELVSYKLSDYLPDEYYERWVELETSFPSADIEERYLKFHQDVLNFIKEQE